MILKCKFDDGDDPTIRDVIDQVSSRRNDDVKYKHAPIHDVLRQSNVKSESINMRIIPTVFNVKLYLRDMQSQTLYRECRMEDSDLALYYEVMKKEKKIVFALQSKGVFSESEVRSLADSFHTFVCSVFKYPDVPIRKQIVLSKADLMSNISLLLNNNGGSEKLLGISSATKDRVIERTPRNLRLQCVYEGFPCTIRFGEDYFRLGNNTATFLFDSIDCIKERGEAILIDVETSNVVANDSDDSSDSEGDVTETHELLFKDEASKFVFKSLLTGTCSSLDGDDNEAETIVELEEVFISEKAHGGEKIGGDDVVSDKKKNLDLLDVPVKSH